MACAVCPPARQSVPPSLPLYSPHYSTDPGLVQLLAVIVVWTLLVMGFCVHLVLSSGTLKFYDYTDWLASSTRPADGSRPLDDIILLKSPFNRDTDWSRISSWLLHSLHYVWYFGIIVWRHGIRARNHVSKSQYPSHSSVVVNTYPCLRIASYFTMIWCNSGRWYCQVLFTIHRDDVKAHGGYGKHAIHVELVRAFQCIYVYAGASVCVCFLCFVLHVCVFFHGCELLNTKKACNTHSTQIIKLSHNIVVLNISTNIIRCVFSQIRLNGMFPML